MIGVLNSIPVIAIGSGWLAVEKPEGLSVHNDPENDLCSRIQTAVEADAILQAALDYDPAFGVHPVHRLDRETSGVMVLACSAGVFRYIARLFEAHQVEKIYQALLHGRLEARAPEQGLWDWPLSREAGGRRLPAGTGKKMPCRTRFEILDYSAHYTLVRFRLETGRKHQIRRHAKLAGHPVVGDDRYGSVRAIAHLKSKGFNRLALHCMEIGFVPSGDSKVLFIKSPELPESIRLLFEKDKEISTF